MDGSMGGKKKGGAYLGDLSDPVLGIVRDT